MERDCIFCKIIAKEIPSHVIYEDEHTLAFLDISKCFEGHTLVVSKSHCENVLDASPEILQNIMNTVQKVSKHYVENCGFQGVNILNCTGETAEQSVFHLHFHIIPRKQSDGLKVFPEIKDNGLDLEQTCQKLRF